MLHEMKLQAEYYNFILNGTKRIEIRLNDEKRQKIKIGDSIKFLKEPELKESFNAKEKLLNVLEKFYTKEKQETYGVLAIVIDLIEKN